MAANTTSTKKKTAEKTDAAATEVTVKETEKIVPKEIDLNQYIRVKNGFHGVLIYQSSRTGEVFRWDGFGSEQDIELLELRNAKNSSKSFFINNWFMFDEEFAWVIDYLGLGQYYKNAVSIEQFDEILKGTPASIKKIVHEMSEGQKRSLAYRAVELISSGDIDSRKTIAALEEELGIELIEK